MSLFGFGKGGGEQAAREMRVPFLGNIPLDPEMVDCGDSGTPVAASAEHSAAHGAFKRIADNWIQLLEGQPRLLYT